MIVSLLPLLWWPVALLHNSGYLFTGTKRVLMLCFPIYALLSVWLAWMCREERQDVMWVLIILLWMSYAAVFYMAM